MPRRSLALLAVAVASFATLGGCAHSKRHAAAPAVQTAGYELPPIERGRVTAVPPDVAQATDGEEVPTAPTAGHSYVALSAAEAQCLAIEYSTLGNLLDRERRAVGMNDLKKCAQPARCAVLIVLHAAAREARNKNSADALKLYYGLAEVEAGLDAVAASEPILADLLAKADELKAADLERPFDRTEFERQQLALASRRADLEIKQAKMNAQLRALLGLPSTPNDAYFWPTEPLSVSTTPLDAEEEVGYGLATRPQLVALRQLPNCGAVDGLDAVRELLGGAHSGLGLKTKLAALKLHRLCDGTSSCEPCARQGQLAELRESRENTIAGEIRAAVVGVVARRRQAALAQEQLESRRVRLSQLEELRETGGANFIDIATAKLHVVEAEQAVVSAVAELKRAEVELHELEGALVAECGR